MIYHCIWRIEAQKIRSIEFKQKNTEIQKKKYRQTTKM